MKNKMLCLASTVLLFFSGSALAQEQSPFQEKVKSVMSMKHRDDADRDRDRNRDPVQALEFFGMREDMRVIEFGPGAGWYTKILAPLLKDKGELYVAASEWSLDQLKPILKPKAMRQANRLPIPVGWNDKEVRYTVDGDLDYGMSDADMVLNIREYHSFNSEDKAKLNKAAFLALKPGGRYVVIDHSRRHMQPETNELRRREDPVQVILEVQAAGFILEKSSDMFFRPDDELRYEVGRKTVAGNTDRFTFVFRKP